MEDADRLTATFNARASQYGRAEVSLALVPGEEGFQLLRGVVRFDRGETEKSVHLNYGPLILTKQSLGVEEGFRFLTGLLEGKIPASSAFSLEEAFQLIDRSRVEPTSLPSPIGRWSRFSDWPAEMFVLTRPGKGLQEPRGPLARLELPLIVDPRSAINDWIGVDTQNLSELANGVLALFPDFRGRIQRIRFEESEINIDVETDLLKRENILVRAAVGYPGEEDEEIEAPERNGTYVLPISGVPTTLYFFLLDKKGGDVLDWAEVHSGWSDFPSQIEFAAPGQRLEHLIDGGETDTVEFKREVGEGGEFVESVVAFANTEGGTILIGVDDNSNIVGVPSPQKETQRTYDLVETHCEPMPPLQIDPVTLRDKEILLVHVSKGSNPPYMHRGRNIIYIRRSGTDRPAKRGDLDELYRRRGAGFG